jgi:hypothetical protein
VIVPLFPLLIFVAPGLWRNICPLAAANQLPRVLGFGRGRTVPDWLRNRSYSIAAVSFFGIVAARFSGLDDNRTAMGVVLGVVVVLAFAGGVVFKGKSGWCSSFCPLLPLQRAYGQTPMVTVPNSHCPTCVGCAKNCYDFKPRAAYLADPDPRWSAPRKLFAAALAGFVLAFFTLAVRPDTSTPQMYGLLMLFVLVGVGEPSRARRHVFGCGAEHLLLVLRSRFGSTTECRLGFPTCMPPETLPSRTAVCWGCGPPQPNRHVLLP